MSLLRFATHDLPSLQEAAADARSLSLRGSAVQDRQTVREILPLLLAECGCGAPVLRETERSLTLWFDLPPELALQVYWQLALAELELDAESHRELTRLCTVSNHAAELPTLDRPCTVHLELRFQGERRRTPNAAAAARA